MYTEISAAFTSINALTTLLKSAQSLGNYNEIVAAVSEVNAKLILAQTGALAGLEKQQAQSSQIDELEKQLVKLKNWEAEASNYETFQVARGLFAYVIKGNVQPMTSTQKLCSNCFHKQIKSFLQEARERTPPRNYRLTCHICNSKDEFHEYIDCS